MVSWVGSLGQWSYDVYVWTNRLRIPRVSRRFRGVANLSSMIGWGMIHIRDDVLIVRLGGQSVHLTL